MGELLSAILLGVTSAAFLRVAERLPGVAWLALTPLCWASLRLAPPEVLIAAAVAGVLCTAPVLADRTQSRLIPLSAGFSALSWGLAYAAAALALQHLPPLAAVIILPLAAVCALVPMRVVGAPRWLSNPLARTQEPWLAVVHIARLGGDLLVAATLAVVSACLALLISGRGLSMHMWLAMSAALAYVAGMLIYGARSLRRAERAAGAAVRVRVAAVVSNVPAPEARPLTGLWALQSPHARDVAAALRRYEPQVARAAQSGAELVLLPECAVCVNAQSRALWLETLASWAKREQVAIIAAFFDESAPRNELAILDASGCYAGYYEKQHPAPRLEPPRGRRCSPGPHHVKTRARTLPLSTVICVDLDYPDLLRSARAAGGLLNVPANDWPVFEAVHHRTAVWAAAISGVPILRATGHGISSIYDGAGRVLASQSSLHAEVVLLADVPLAPSTV